MILSPRHAAVGLVALTLACAPALAQRTPVYQSGTWVARDAVKATTQGTLTKAGGLQGDTLGYGVNPHSISDALGLGLCVNSAVTTGAFNAFCLGHDADGNGLLSLDSYGGLAAKTFYFRKDGVLYDFPFALPGTGVLGPVTSTANALAVWNNTGGTLLKDGAGVTVGHTGAIRIQGPGPTVSLVPPQQAGGNTLFIGNTGETPIANWMETLAGYTTSDSKFAALSNTGGYGIVGASRVADNPLLAAPAYSFGVGGFVQANAVAPGQTGIAGFFQAINSGIGTSQGVEVDSVNRSGPSPSFSPYLFLTQLPATLGLWIGSGQGDVFALPSTAAIGIVNNLGTWRTGIFFAANAIEGGTGADADAFPLEAMALSRMHAINFWNSGDTMVSGPASRIYSTVQSTHTRTADLVFGNDGIYMMDHALTKPVAAFKGGAVSDCGMIVDNQTTGSLGISYTGTATNCNSVHSTKGVGSHTYWVGPSEIFKIISTGLEFRTLPAVAAGTGKRFLCIDTVTKVVYEGSGASCN